MEPCIYLFGVGLPQILHLISFCASLCVCRHVMNELLETERAYVEELLCVLQVFNHSTKCLTKCLFLCLSLCHTSFICVCVYVCVCVCVFLQGYASEMDNPAMLHLIPAPLQNKKEVLFGNMPEIYHFHRRWSSAICLSLIISLHLCLIQPQWCPPRGENMM